MVRPNDTSSAALARQREAFRRMTPQRRVEVAAEMSDEIRGFAEAGIRNRHPEYSEAQVRDALVDLLLGRDVAMKVRQRRPAPTR